MRHWESACYAPTALGLEAHATVPGFFVWAPGVWNQVLMFVKQVLYPLGHLLSPRLWVACRESDNGWVAGLTSQLTCKGLECRVRNVKLVIDREWKCDMTTRGLQKDPDAASLTPSLCVCFPVTMKWPVWLHHALHLLSLHYEEIKATQVNNDGPKPPRGKDSSVQTLFCRFGFFSFLCFQISGTVRGPDSAFIASTVVKEPMFSLRV